MEELLKLINDNVSIAKEAISTYANEIVEDYMDINNISIENVDINIERICGEITAAYAILGMSRQQETMAETALKKKEAQIYMNLYKNGENKPTIENLKRESLLDTTLIPYQKAYGEALCKRITNEGICKSLETKREIVKTLSIKKHEIIKNGDY